MLLLSFASIQSFSIPIEIFNDLGSIDEEFVGKHCRYSRRSRSLVRMAGSPDGEDRVRPAKWKGASLPRNRLRTHAREAVSSTSSEDGEPVLPFGRTSERRSFDWGASAPYYCSDVVRETKDRKRSFSTEKQRPKYRRY